LREYTLELLHTTQVGAAMQELMEHFAVNPIPEASLARISVPTALIWGRYDPIVPLAVGEAASVRYRWPLHVIEDAGNEPALEAPDAFVRALLDGRSSTEHRG
jgi:pimeloyl-ACP methyl ester carboxylesterase